MKTKYVDWAYWILSFLPLFVTGIVFPYFPDTIPAHWNAAGEVNRYGSKIELFILPVLILAIAHFSIWFNAWINKGFKDTKQINAFMKLSLIVVLNIITYGIFFKTYETVHSQATFDLSRIILIVLGFFNVALAYYLPKTKQNSRIGIRTKWTLLNEEVWRKTHRLGGWLLTVGGLTSIILSLLVSGFMCIYMVLFIEILITGIVVLYSYCSYRKLRRI